MMMTKMMMTLRLLPPCSLIFLLTVDSSIQWLASDWSVTYTPPNVCALNGSAVFLNCTYKYPSTLTVTTAYWSNNVAQLPNLNTVAGYVGRVQYFPDVFKHAVQISNVIKTDQTKYYFRYVTNAAGGQYTGITGLMLSVTVLQVTGSQEVTEGQMAILTCNTTCSLTDPPTFIWFKDGLSVTTSLTNGSLILNPTSSTDAGNYSCAVKGYEQLASPAFTLNIRYPPKNVWVSVSPTGDILEGIIMNMTCNSDGYPALWNYTWYKDTAVIGQGKTYTFNTTQAANSGVYFCKANNTQGAMNSSGVNLNVLYPPRSVLMTVSPSGQITEGASVTLTCTCDANPQEQNYIWYKGNNSVSTGQTYFFSKIMSTDSGDYKCQCRNIYGDANSTTQTLNVLYPPRSVLVSVRPLGDILEGTLVNLTCTVDANPPAENYTWFKGNTLLGQGKIYSFSKINATDSGVYKCQCWNKLGTANSTNVTLDVLYPPRNVSVSVSPPGDILEGSLVNLTCTGDANPKDKNYTWFKGETFLGRGQIYSFLSINSTDSGLYKCQCWNKFGYSNSTAMTLNVLYAPRNVLVSISPAGEIVEGSPVTLTCTGDANPAVVIYTWFKAQTFLSQGQTYSFVSISSTDSGLYKCQCKNTYWNGNSTGVTLDVLYPIKYVSVSVSPSNVILEGGLVNLTCTGDANPPAENYTWFKGDTFVGQGKTYIFSSIASQNSGGYICKCGNKFGYGNSSTMTLDVQYPPRNISVSFNPPGKILEFNFVELSCTGIANPPVTNCAWFKGETLINKGENYSFSHISSKESGDYKCQCRNKHGDGNSTLTLNVMYPPKNFYVAACPSSEIPETGSVTLICNSDANPPADSYTWYKDQTLIASGQTYNLSDVSADDRGKYRCTFRNDYGSGSSIATLDILFAPKTVHIETIGLTTLICKCEANPPVENYTWYLDGGTSPMGYGNVFVASQSGSYYCQAQNMYSFSNSAAQSVTIDAGNSNTILYVIIAILVICLVCLLIAIYMKKHKKKKDIAAKNQAPKPIMTPEEIIFGNAPTVSSIPVAEYSSSAPPKNEVPHSGVTFTSNGAAYSNAAADLDDSMIYSSLK